MVFSAASVLLVLYESLADVQSSGAGFVSRRLSGRRPLVARGEFEREKQSIR
jgi:hypothetical protein